MARLPYVDINQSNIQTLARLIKAERGSVLHLYRMLLWSPPLAAGWLRFLTAIRKECTLPGALRELVIMRVAILNGATYESAQHRPIAIKEGVTNIQLDELENWQDSDAFNKLERSVLAYTDAMTRDVRISDEVFTAIHDQMDGISIVELTATVAAYNMVSRFLEALQIHDHDPISDR